MLRQYRSALSVIALLSITLFILSLVAVGVYVLLAGGSVVISLSNGLFTVGSLVIVFGTFVEYFKLGGLNKRLAERLSSLPFFSGISMEPRGTDLSSGNSPSPGTGRPEENGEHIFGVSFGIASIFTGLALILVSMVILLVFYK